MKRKHQKEFEQVITARINGATQNHCLLDVCPGGGKSALPVEACRLITAGIADKLAWIVPRASLQRQGETAFVDPFLKRLYGHNFTARSSTNDAHPSRGCTAWISTYQAIASDTKNTVANEFRKRRYVLVLDEAHHVEKGGTWEKAIAPLVKLAKYVVLMTGTLKRNSGNPISFIPYEHTVDGFTPVSKTTDEQAFIRYSRTDALKEQAILPLQFSCHDGAVKWLTDSGIEMSFSEMSSVPEKYATAAIYTAVDTKYAEELVDEGMRHWAKHKKEQNPRSKAIIVTANINHARKNIDLLKQMGIGARIATSHDSTTAHRNIELFRGPKLDVLVCVGMFYEGFDCAPLTHVISLTHYRSEPWIEQMVARANRVDQHAGPYRAQSGFVFCPDDPLMRNLIDRFRKEQAPMVDSMDVTEREKREPKQLDMFDFLRDPHAPGRITTIESRMNGAGAIHLLGSQHECVPESDRESFLRLEIDSHIKRYANGDGDTIRFINGRIKGLFCKKRDHMTRTELERLLAHLRHYYKIASQTNIFSHNGGQRNGTR